MQCVDVLGFCDAERRVTGAGTGTDVCSPSSFRVRNCGRLGRRRHKASRDLGAKTKWNFFIVRAKTSLTSLNNVYNCYSHSFARSYARGPHELTFLLRPPSLPSTPSLPHRFRRSRRSCPSRRTRRYRRSRHCPPPPAIPCRAGAPPGARAAS